MIIDVNLFMIKLLNLMKNLLLLLGIAILLLSCSKDHKHQEAPFDGSKVNIDVNLLKDGIPVFYSFIDREDIINFFILRDDEGIHAYFDACQQCYKNKLGFRYEEDNLLCNSCNVGYPVSKIKQGVGGCYPIKLEGKHVAGIFEIEKNSLIKGKKYF